MYNFIKEDAKLERTYLFGGSYHYDYNRLTNSGDYHQFGIRYTKFFDVFEENDEEGFIKARGSHLITPPDKLGASIIEDAAGVSLPSDLNEYYSSFGEAFLFFIDFYKILSPFEVVEANLDENAVLGGKPWRVIKICDLGDNHYVAMLRDDDEWKYVFLPSGYTNATFLTSWEEEGSIIFENSFSRWLRGVFLRKGEHIHIPPGTHSVESDEVPDSRLLDERIKPNS